MTTTMSVRSVPAAATGAVFAVCLTLAAGDGGTVSAAQHVAATAALTLLIPFTVYVGTILRAQATNATDRWLATTAVAAGAVGTCMKLLSDAPEIARSDSRVASGPTSAALDSVAATTTVLALVPLAVFALAVGVAALRTGAVPRWLGVGALVTGASLAANGCFQHTENVPALLVLSLWCLLASVHLVRAARRNEVPASQVGAASTA
jgi:hypothetical protein